MKKIGMSLFGIFLALIVFNMAYASEKVEKDAEEETRTVVYEVTKGLR